MPQLAFALSPELSTLILLPPSALLPSPSAALSPTQPAPSRSQPNLFPTQPAPVRSQTDLFPSQLAPVRSQPALSPTQPAPSRSQPSLLTPQPAPVRSQPDLFPSPRALLRSQPLKRASIYEKLRFFLSNTRPHLCDGMKLDKLILNSRLPSAWSSSYPACPGGFGHDQRERAAY